LLFDVAALLITSAAIRPAAEASSAPQLSSISQVIAGGTTASVPGAVLISPAAVSHSVPISVFEVAQAPSEVGSLTGIALLSALSTLPRDEVASFDSAHAGVIARLLANPPAANEVTSWWSSLGTSARDSLAASAPNLVGNLDGVPTRVRNDANRTWVSQSMVALKASSSVVSGRSLSLDTQYELHMLTQVRNALATKGGPARSLLSIDASGQGKAAIVIGNLDTADYVTYMVPGMFFTVDGQVKDWTADADDLYTQQVAWLNRLDPVAPGQQQKTVAVVAWMGYQTPDLTDIGSLDLAEKGRDELARVVEGMQAERAGNLPYTTIVAHSYGSTAALMALSQYDFSVNALAVVGSPGSSVQSAKDLHVQNGNVFVGAAAWDPVPSSAWFGSDPAAPSYGAKSMGVSGQNDAITGKPLGTSIGHNEYFDKGSESIRNLALIGIGRGDLVMKK
jgi:Alpha/beta hydrolase